MVDGNRDVYQSKDSERLNEFISVIYKERKVCKTFEKDLKKICKLFEIYTFDKDLKCVLHRKQIFQNSKCQP